jgi:integrase/recombinase XerD
MLMYGSGLRVGEVVKLKKEDLDFVEKTVFVYRSKVNKDRFTLLSDKSIESLHQYMQMYKPQVWLFESPEGSHYSERSVQQIFADALKKAKITKRVSTHSLRHAFATHLLKAHVDLDFVRKVLGHNSILTTQRYLHVLKSELTQTRSPLDDIDL